MKPTAQTIVAACILAHALFALLAAYWLYINILVILIAICSWPFWWASLGYRQMRVKVVVWSLVGGTLIYIPSLKVIQVMLKVAG
jgi:hypothetical protein